MGKRMRVLLKAETVERRRGGCRRGEWRGKSEVLLKVEWGVRILLTMLQNGEDEGAVDGGEGATEAGEERVRCG